MRSCPVYPLTFWNKLRGKQRPRDEVVTLLSYYLSKALKRQLYYYRLWYYYYYYYQNKKRRMRAGANFVCVLLSRGFHFGVRFDPSNRSDSPFVFVHTIECVSSSFSISTMSLSVPVFFLFFFVMSSGEGSFIDWLTDSFCLSGSLFFVLLSNLFALIVTPVV